MDLHWGIRTKARLISSTIVGGVLISNRILYEGFLPVWRHCELGPIWAHLRPDGQLIWWQTSEKANLEECELHQGDKESYGDNWRSRASKAFANVIVQIPRR